MNVENKQLKEFLLDTDMIAPEAVSALFSRAEKEGVALGDILLRENLLPEEELQKLYSHILGIPFVDVGKDIIPSEILHIIPAPIAKKSHIVAFEKKDNELKVAMLDPRDLQTIDFIRKKSGLRIVPCLTTKESIEGAIKQYEKSLKAEFGDIINEDAKSLTTESKDGSGGEDLEKIAQDIPVVRIVETLLKHAILQQASDIHIEPEEKDIIVRYRIDGILHDAMNLPKKVLPGIVARVKVLSNLKLDEHRLPQDGRFKIEQETKKMAFRVSILPVFDGEKIVMRLLDESSKGLSLESIGFVGRNLEVVHQQIKKPNGMVLVTGPTGSGKTTTLYTVLDILNTPEVNISTVEDPVEYRMERINQTQVNAKIGMSFAAALRALLRQDPDIIMVGEIRDSETMEIALHAAMTGHLVLSTLHTNSAAAAVPRMLDMGAEPFLVASTTNVIIAQRLSRKLCGDCKKEYTMSEEKLSLLRNALDMDEMLTIAQKNSKGKDRIDDWKKVKWFQATGCQQCGGEGYHGRVGIFEVLEVNEAIEKCIVEKATSEAIEQQAKKDGMRTMIQDGILKAIAGVTTVEEVLRITQE